MSLPVLLQEVASELQLVNDMCRAYLNKRTGEIILITDEDRRLADDPDGEKNLPDWQRDLLPKIRHVIESEDWLALPSQWEIHDYRIMERFCCSIEQDEAREQLLQAIHGRGAFRRFRETAERLHLMEDWYAYRDQAYEKIAARWLEAHEIPFVQDADARSQPPSAGRERND